MLDTPSQSAWVTAFDWVVRGGFLASLALLAKLYLERGKPAAEIELSDAQARRHDTETKLAVYDRAFARVAALEASVEKLEARLERANEQAERWREHAGNAEEASEGLKEKLSHAESQLRIYELEIKDMRRALDEQGKKYPS